MFRKLFLSGIVLVTGVAAISPALAVPGFSRKHNMACSSCHTAWPALNATGREYKENGYRLVSGRDAPDELKKVADNLLIEGLTYVSAKINGRLYDKKDTDSEFKLRPLHEVEVFLAGNAGNVFSFFAEIEAEDENDFSPEVPHGVVGWHPRREANVVAGYGPLFVADPYSSLSDARRLTRSHKAPLDVAFEAGDKFRSSTQLFTFYGRANSLYYSAAVSAGSDDPEGGDGKDASLRVAYDFPVVTVGGFYIDGTRDDTVLGMSKNFSRTGITFDLQKDNLVAYGTWFEGDDDNLLTMAEESNSAAYVEAFYMIGRDGEPRIAPLVRWETFESNNGNDSTSALAVAAIGYVRSNINVGLEYWKQTDVPGSGPKDDRLTLFFNFGL